MHVYRVVIRISLTYRTTLHVREQILRQNDVTPANCRVYKTRTGDYELATNIPIYMRVCLELTRGTTTFPSRYRCPRLICPRRVVAQSQAVLYW